MTSRKYQTAEAIGMQNVPPGYDNQPSIISMPSGGGGEAATVASPSQHTSIPMKFDGIPGRRPSSQAVDVVIYFADNHGLKFKVEDAPNIEAGELFEMVMEEVKLPNKAREVFSLWMVSDLLELQLKPNHVPFKLAAFWEELLIKYTCAKEEEIERDEPVIVFRRNVFFSPLEEKNMKYKREELEIVRLLYHEAKENVIDGRYTVSGMKRYEDNDVQNWYDDLAGIQALLQEESFNESILSPEYFSKKLKQYYPGHLCPKKWWKIDKTMEPHHRLFRAHGKQYKRFGDLRGAALSKMFTVYQAYLKLCWMLPYYGAAFFHGQIEHPRYFKLVKNDDPVWIAINTSGIYFIDMDDVVFLMGLLFSGKFSWNFAEPNAPQSGPVSKGEKVPMPCIFFQFEDRECGKYGPNIYKKVLQVFSKEAKSVDGLLDACYVLRSRKLQEGFDEVDAHLKELDGVDGDHLIESDNKFWIDFNKRALTSFNMHGEVVKTGLKTVKSSVRAP